MHDGPMSLRTLLLLSLLPACAADEPEPEWVGENLSCDTATDTVAYRIDVIDTPLDTADVDAFAWDLDGDGTTDNMGGNVISAIERAIDVDLQGAVTEALDIDLVQIGLTVETCGAPDYALVSLVRGLELDRAQTPPRLVAEEITRFASVARGALPRAATDGKTRFPVGQLIHPIADDWIEANELVVVIDEISADEVRGRLIAGLDAAQAFATVTRGFQAKVVDRMAELGPCTPDSCDPVLRTILDVFDTDRDGGVDIDEVRENSLMRTLLQADLDLDGDGTQEAYSVGVGFRASRVRLEL